MIKNNKIIFFICLVAILVSMTGCGNSNEIIKDVVDEPIIEEPSNKKVIFQGLIIDVLDKSILVQPNKEYSESKSSDKIVVGYENLGLKNEYSVGDTVAIEYNGIILESYPAQLGEVFSVKLIAKGKENLVFWNGEFYKKDTLSEQTLKWLEMSEDERMVSSYYPSDLMDLGGLADLDNRQEDWGVELLTENITPSGLTIICNQAGGTNVFELNTGSFYVIQKLVETGYVDVEYLPQEYDIGWTSEAYIINKDGSTKWDINWEWLYGKLTAGEYRIGKEIMNFRGPGDFDQEMVYAHFEIK